MKTTVVRLSQVAVFVALAFGAVAFHDEFIHLDVVPIVDIAVVGFELAIICLLVIYIGNKFLPTPQLVSSPRRSPSAGFLILLAFLSPFILIFGGFAILSLLS